MKPVAEVTLYSIAHAAVDAVCAGIVFSLLGPGFPLVFGLLLYNGLAFAGQPAVGLLADRFRRPRATAAIGAVLTVVAFPVTWIPHAGLVAVTLAGIGNAVFHVGGGVVSLTASPGRATLPGLFVAPGAAGLAIGTLVGRAQGPMWLIALTLLASWRHFSFSAGTKI